jgi:hypothetical protein
MSTTEEKRRGPRPGSMAVDKIAGKLLNLHVSEGPNDEMLTTAEVAKWLRVSEVWMKIARVKGNGPPFVVVGRLIAYRRDAVRRWLRSREVQTTVNKRSHHEAP